MKLSKKEYKTVKTKNYIKTNEIFFFFNGVNQTTYDWITTEQELANMNFTYYKVFNKAAINTLNISIYQNVKSIINGITFFIKPNTDQKSLSKYLLLSKFDSFLLTMLAIKFNQKIYSTTQLKNTYSLSYKNNKLLLYQFGISNTKFYYK